LAHPGRIAARPTDSRHAHSKLARYLSPREAAGTKLNNFIPPKYDTRSADGPTRSGSLCLCPNQSRSDSLRDTDAFLFSDPGRNRDHQLPRRSRGAKVLLGETDKLNPVRSKPFDVLERFGDAFAGQAIQSPNEDHIESTLCCISEHPLKLHSIRSATAFVVDVFVSYFPAVPFGELA
jgi:hypothetical protein